MEQEGLRRLLRRYAADDCTEQERKFLEELVLRNPVVGNWEWNSEEEKVLTGIRIKQAIDERRFGVRNRSRRMPWYWAVAASFLIAAGGWWFFQESTINPPENRLRITETSACPTDGVRLTLADGTVLSLDSLESGLVGVANGLEITKNDTGLM